MNETEAIRRRLEPYYGLRLPDVFIGRLVQTLQQRNLAEKLESLLTATESLLARLLEGWNFQGIDGFPLRLGSCALLHLVQPSPDLLAKEGDFCFCIGIQKIGTLSLKFSVNGKVHSSTVNTSDYTKIWSTDFYKRILGRSDDFADRLFTKAVLYDLDKRKYVYKSLKEVVGEINLPARHRSLSIPAHGSVQRPSQRVDNSDKAQTGDRIRSRSSSLGAKLGKRTDEDKEYKGKISELCGRLSRLLCDDSAERNNWIQLALNLLDWDFAKCKTFEKMNERDPAGQMLGKFVDIEQSHKLNSQKWIYHRIVLGLHSIGRHDLLRDLSISPLSTPTDENAPDLGGLDANEPLQMPRKCSERSSSSDVVLPSGKSTRPMGAFGGDIPASSKANLPQKEDEPGIKKTILIMTRSFDQQDLRQVTSGDEDRGQPCPGDQFRQHHVVRPPEEHNPPNTGTQPFPGQRSRVACQPSPGTEVQAEGITHPSSDSHGSGRGYPEPDDAVQKAIASAQEDLLSAGEQLHNNAPYASPDNALSLALSQKPPDQTERNHAGLSYPPIGEAVQAARLEAGRTDNLVDREEPDGCDT